MLVLFTANDDETAGSDTEDDIEDGAEVPMNIVLE